MKWTPDEARDLAAEHMSGLGRRWAHVQAVAKRAVEVADAADAPEVVIAAAWLHDLGYAPRVATTGFHALDGARRLADLGAPAELVSLVAYHTGAEYEAEERGLLNRLAAFARPCQVDLDALTLADMTTSPTGDAISVEDRVADIFNRYAPTDAVHRAVARSQSYLRACAQRAEQRLRSADVRL